MTEAEWLAANRPEPMLEFIRDRASERKLRLFACACCRRIVDWFPHQRKRSRRVLEVAEQYADGLTDEVMLVLARDGRCPCTSAARRGGVHAARAAIVEAVMAVPKQRTGASVPSLEPARESQERERAVQAALFRDLFCNPFSPAHTVGSSVLAWQERTVVKFASDIYQGRQFDRLPLLADALEDAGCTDAELLGHLRGPGPHVRGCWALDLVLSKS
jgi:hypothetical protein